MTTRQISNTNVGYVNVNVIKITYLALLTLRTVSLERLT